jgi:hypothetical protein
MWQNGTDVSKSCPKTGLSVGKYSGPVTTELRCLYSTDVLDVLIQGYTNSRCQITMATKFCTVTPNNLWVLNMELASCHPSGTYIFDVTPTSIKTFCNSCLN